MSDCLLAESVMRRIDALGQVTDEPGKLTRCFCSDAMRRANALVAGWMREAGMVVRQDSLGNLIGRYPSDPPESKSLLLGSHLDTVRDAGKFDGPLGVLTAIAAVQELHDKNRRLPFQIEVFGFADEEGLRYQSTYLGSKAAAGTFQPDLLLLKDSDGISMADAIRNFGGNPEGIASAQINPSQCIGYVEVHIEQGPILEQSNLAVGVVSAIAGQTRARITFIGRAGHAGSTPMSLRHDALCAAAQFITEAESFARGHDGLVATVGSIAAFPGASNVIPGQVELSLDVRHADDQVRTTSCAALRQIAANIASSRKQTLDWKLVHQVGATTCDPDLSTALADAVRQHQPHCIRLLSGAGHDAAAMAEITPVAMLFVRCQGGVSHHPGESVALEDIRLAIKVLRDFLVALHGTV